MTRTPIPCDSTNHFPMKGQAVLRAVVTIRETKATARKPWLKMDATASVRLWPARREARIWMASANPTGITRNSSRTESATARAPSSAIPTRARKIVSIKCRRVSLAPARITGSETFHTTRESLLMLIGIHQYRFDSRRAGFGPASQSVRAI